MTAWTERHGSGWRVRARVDGRKRTIATCASHAEAETLRAAYERRSGRGTHALTLSVYGETFLAARRARGVRSIEQDRNRWRTYIDADEIGALALRDVRRGDVVAWRDRLLRRGLAAQTVRNALNLLRVALADALDAECVADNAARTVRVPRSAAAHTREELGGVLRPGEVLMLLDSTPVQHRDAVRLALLTGLRWSELAHLAWADVRDDSLLIRRGRGGGATKAGRPRVQPLLDATRAVLDALPRTGALVLGGDRPRQWRPRAWTSWVAAAGIERRVRWHDLRHTCATALLAGWWGRRWSLEEVRAYLGHSSVTVTERYARFLDESLARAVADTSAPILPPRAEGGAGKSLAISRSQLGDLNPRPTVYEGAATAPKNRTKQALSPPRQDDLPPRLAGALLPEPAPVVLGLAKAYRAALAGDECGCRTALESLAKLKPRTRCVRQI